MTEVQHHFAWQTLKDSAEEFAAESAWASDRLQTIRRQFRFNDKDGKQAIPAWLSNLKAARHVLPHAAQIADRALGAAQICFVEETAKVISNQSTRETAALSMLAHHRPIMRTRRVASYKKDGSIDLTYTPAERIDAELMKLCLIAQNYRDLPPILIAIGAFAHLIAIHPFADGNGRAARLLMSALLRHAELWGDETLPLVYLMYRDRNRHLGALRPVLVDGNWSLFVPYALQWMTAAAELAVVLRPNQDAHPAAQAPQSFVLIRQSRSTHYVTARAANKISR